MQRWRTVIKRRWALSAKWNLKVSCCKPFLFLLVQSSYQASEQLYPPQDNLSTSWLNVLRNMFSFSRFDDKWLMEDRVKCRSRLLSSRSMRQVNSLSELLHMFHLFSLTVNALSPYSCCVQEHMFNGYHFSMFIWLTEVSTNVSSNAELHRWGVQELHLDSYQRHRLQVSSYNGMIYK